MSYSEIEGHLAVPDAGDGPGILVIHPWWGLNDTVKGFCNRLAEEGFVAYAPDLYHGNVATMIEDAERLSDGLDTEQAKADVANGVALLCERLGQPDCQLGVIGFSLGAYYALELANDDPDHISAVVLFYGTGNLDYPRSKAAYLGHFAEDDQYEEAAYVASLETALAASGHKVAFYTYEGLGHWFFEPDRTDAYNEPAAQLAWKRTLAFLRYTLPS
jgi:carboxymethylenebutenolidase